MKAVRSVVTATLWWGLAGCSFAPEGAMPVEPPAEYQAWFNATEVCSGRGGDFERIRWYVVPGRDFVCPTGRCVARWEPGHRIYLAEHWQGNEMVVRHEILHDLLEQPGHPDPPFGTGCPLTWDSWRSHSRAGVADLPATID